MASFPGDIPPYREDPYRGKQGYVQGYWIDDDGKYRYDDYDKINKKEPAPKYPLNMYPIMPKEKKTADGKTFPIVYTGTYPHAGPDRPEDNIKAIAKIGPGGMPYTGDNGEPATDINGTVYMDQINDGAAKVTYCIMKLPPGEYGLHISEVKPFGVEPDVPVRHIAEIATLEVNSTGIASGKVNRVRVALKGDGVMDQATVMLHAKPDKNSEVIAYGVIRVNGHEKKNPHWDTLELDERKWYEGAAQQKAKDHEWAEMAKKYKSPLA